ncbi:MAG TPA: hypothetical protein VKV18_03585, partial [Chthonomonas sp.]
ERNGTRLHQATYQPLRKAHPDLPAQLVVAARRKAGEALKSVQERKKPGRSVSGPQSALCPVRYDARLYWVRLQDGCASLTTTQGRVCVTFRLCNYYTRSAIAKGTRSGRPPYPSGQSRNGFSRNAMATR